METASFLSACGVLSVIYGYIDENGDFVRRMRFAYGQTSKKSVNQDEILAELVDQRHFKKDSFSHVKN